MHEILEALGQVSGPRLFLLLFVVSLHMVARAWLVATTVEGMPLRRAVVVAEAHTGCSNALIGGAPVGVAVKTAMFRSWGVAPAAIATSIVASAVAPTIAMWGFALVQLGPVVAVLGLATIAAAITALVRHDPFLPRLARLLGFLHRLALVATRRVWPRLHRRLARADVAASVANVGSAARQLLRRRGKLVLAAAVTTQLSLAMVLYCSTVAVGAGASIREVVSAFALVRVATSIVPVPSGVGVLDVGIVGALMQAGAARPSAMAALAVFRGVTFFLPMVTGAVAIGWWKRRRGALSSVAESAVLRLEPVRVSRVPAPR